MQTDATLLDVTSMLRPPAHPVVRCCGLLGVVAQVTRLHVALEILEQVEGKRQNRAGRNVAF